MTASLACPPIANAPHAALHPTPGRLRHGWGVGSALALFLLSGGEAQAEWVERSFDVQPGGRLVLDANVGSVRVGTHSRDEVEVRVARRGFLPFPDVVMRQEGDDIYVESREVPVVDWLPGWAAHRLRFEITVPSHYSVDIETGRGGISIEDAAGHIEARTRHGRLAFHNVEGTIEGRSQGGAIEVDEARGSVDLVTAGGAIQIEEVEGDVSAHTQGGRMHVRDAHGDLELQSGGGTIRIEGAQGSVVAHSRGGSIRVHFEDEPAGEIETAGGDIDVWFPADEGTALDVQATHGEIEVEHPMILDGAAVGGRLSGQVNGGGPTLHLRTHGGAIRVREL